MTFNPGLEIGDEVTNDDIHEIFSVDKVKGIRYSKKNNIMVLISKKVNVLYEDKWESNGTILNYTGMGQKGDQTVTNENARLYNSTLTGLEMFLFEVFKPGIYTYRGKVALANLPYTAHQKDCEGKMRLVYIFPLELVDEFDEEEINNFSDSELISKLAGSLGKKIESKKSSEVTVNFRNKWLKVLVKRMASGTCQLCGQKAPFLDKHNVPFLEEHHVKYLSKGGKDSIDNVVAICPNCHRKVHELEESNTVLKLKNVALENKRRFDNMIKSN